MEPVTHILAGACLSRSGANRRAAYATLTMAIAAELPDMDTLWSLRGPVEGFTHHRGITHTFLGLPFEAAFLVGSVYAFHRWRVRRASKLSPAAGSSRAKPLTPAPVRWGVLYVLALVGLLSHLLLDYTNNYGIRPFFPLNDRWYAGSIVFIFDPAIFLLLLVGLSGAWLFSLIGAEVGAKRSAFRGRGWALAALAGVVCLWALRTVEHTKAVTLAMGQSVREPHRSTPLPNQEPDQTSEDASPVPTDGPPVFLPATRALASPDPLNPFLWSVATDFGPVYQLADADTLRGTLEPGSTFYWKPADDPLVRSAERSPLGRAYLDWSPMPVLDASDRGPDGITTVSFRDLRFMGGWLSSAGRTALQGSVDVDAAGHIAGQAMDGRPER